MFFWLREKAATLGVMINIPNLRRIPEWMSLQVSTARQEEQSISHTASHAQDVVSILPSFKVLTREQC